MSSQVFTNVMLRDTHGKRGKPVMPPENEKSIMKGLQKSQN